MFCCRKQGLKDEHDAIQSPSLHICEFNTLIYHLVFAWQRISKVCRDNLYHTTLQHAGEPVASTISLFSEVPQRTESTDSLELSLLPENMDKNNDISLFNHSSPTCVVEVIMNLMSLLSNFSYD